MTRFLTRRLTRCLALLAPGLAACATAAAPAPAAPRPPALDPALQSLAFYVGSWRCRGTTFAAPGQREEAWDATVEVAPELDGKWLSVRMTGPGPSRTIEHKGYDAARKRWLHIAVANDGTAAMLSSEGWTGSQMVFRIEAGTPEEQKVRATFTRIDDRSFSHSESQDAEGGPQKLWEKVCRKV